jgi:putative ABC transport system substrate-binding protein
MATTFGRREFVTLLAGAAAAPVFAPCIARAQQRTVPSIGLLHTTTLEGSEDRIRAFSRGLKEAGFVEGENATIVYRFAENRIEKLPELASDLVRRRVAVIVTFGGFRSAAAAKSATKTIPIVFNVAEDPVRIGLVKSLARPDGNVTGINFLSAELAAKRLELLRVLLPKMSRVGVLLNPTGPTPESTLKEVEAAASKMGLQIHVHHASTSREIDEAYAAIMRERSDALFVGTDPLFTARRVQLVHLATRHVLPAIYGGRQHVEAGGLIGYGGDIMEASRQMGTYAGRILKGTKPADLPVLQSTKLDLVINHQTARTLGIAVPPSLISIADEVIE